MKKFVISSVLVLSAITPFVIAACPSPNLPACPLSAGLRRTPYIDIWTCCDQTVACSTDGTKYPRFQRGQTVAEYLGTDGQWHQCVTGGYVDGPEINCCD